MFNRNPGEVSHERQAITENTVDIPISIQSFSSFSENLAEVVELYSISQ